jgi:oligopeptide/dipeptide ABC transporter ATP-binding protein
MSTAPTSTARVTSPTVPVVEARGVAKRFPIERGVLRRTVGHVHAVDGVDLAVLPGTTMGLVGESGSGKSTLGRLVLRLLDPSDGRILFGGRDVTEVRGRELRALRCDAQLVFQDPHSAFDPSTTILGALREPLRAQLDLSRADQTDRARELVGMVGLDRGLLDRYPHELSGGQLQRLAIARSLALEPALVVLDEPVSSLDVSTQAQVVNLLRELQDRLGIAYLFVAHDLAVVRHVSDDLSVMYLGRIVEQGRADAIYATPRHPYTDALLSAIPVPDPERQRARERIVLRGDIPSPAAPPRGCNFHTRCPYVMDVCRSVEPEPFVTDDGTMVACHLHTSGPELRGAPLPPVPPVPPAPAT